MHAINSNSWKYIMATSNRHKKLATFTFFSLLILLIGIVVAVVYLVKFRGQEGTLALALMWTAIVASALGFVLSLICMILWRLADKQDKKLKEQALTDMIDPTKNSSEQTVNQTFVTNQQFVVDPGNITYIPSHEAYDFVVMGQYQTLDQKFEEISRMDKTQFVIYVARLFSRKGYQVKLTPVVDNHDIDLLVEKMGVTIAVGVILTHKVLCKEDIVCVKNGRSYYGVNNSMALTNMYFDRTALDYAKEEHMSLVDRNILAEDFMV